MQIEIYSSFSRDTKKLTDTLKQEISNTLSIISLANSLSEIPNVKSMQGGKKAKDAYRMRINNYRICFYFRSNIVELVRFLPRKDVYKVFP